MDPLVSIILATYRDKRLAESLQSVFSQTYRNIEIIVVNDDPANKEFVEKLIGAYGNAVFISNKNNLGLTKSLNIALKKAQGEIIVRHDSDDFSLPERVETIVTFFEANPAVDIVCSTAYLEAFNKRSVLRIPVSHGDIVEQLSFRNCLIHSALSFRSKIIKQIGFYNENYRYAQDYDLYLRAINCGLIFAAINKPLIVKCFDESNITVTKRKQQLLYELSAKSNFFAAKEFSVMFVFSIIQTLIKIMIPSWFRVLRLKIWKL